MPEGPVETYWQMHDKDILSYSLQSQRLYSLWPISRWFIYFKNVFFAGALLLKRGIFVFLFAITCHFSSSRKYGKCRTQWQKKTNLTINLIFKATISPTKLYTHPYNTYSWWRILIRQFYSMYNMFFHL